MPEGKPVTLTVMRAGQSGVIVQVEGGPGMVQRLSAMGLRPGKRITKISSMLMRGPVTVQVDRGQVAVGYGMANRIMVEPS